VTRRQRLVTPAPGGEDTDCAGRAALGLTGLSLGDQAIAERGRMIRDTSVALHRASGFRAVPDTAPSPSEPTPAPQRARQLNGG